MYVVQRIVYSPINSYFECARCSKNPAKCILVYFQSHSDLSGEPILFCDEDCLNRYLQIKNDSLLLISFSEKVARSVKREDVKGKGVICAGSLRKPPLFVPAERIKDFLGHDPGLLQGVEKVLKSDINFETHFVLVVYDSSVQRGNVQVFPFDAGIKEIQ